MPGSAAAAGVYVGVSRASGSPKPAWASSWAIARPSGSATCSIVNPGTFGAERSRARTAMPGSSVRPVNPSRAACASTAGVSPSRVTTAAAGSSASADSSSSTASSPSAHTALKSGTGTAGHRKSLYPGLSSTELPSIAV
jgi:hypothetical protein